MESPDKTGIPISDRAAYLGRVRIGVTVPLLALCLVPFSARVYTRVRPVVRLGWDDVFIVLGFVSRLGASLPTRQHLTSRLQCFTIADWVMLQLKLFMTPESISIPEASTTMKLTYLAIPVWNAAMTCIKVSVALTLLRIPVNRLWTAFLCAVAGLQVAYFIGNTVYIFMECRPLAAMWDLAGEITDATCFGPGAVRIASNVGAGINITTDMTLSLAPMVVLWRMRRPLRERILVCGLMAIGLFASAASIVKAVLVREWGNPQVDPWALGAAIGTWTILEQLLAMLAACSPSLKGPLQRLLGRFGILLTRYNSQLSFIQRSDTCTVRGEMEQGAKPVYFSPGDSAQDRSDDTSVELGLGDRVKRNNHE